MGANVKRFLLGMLFFFLVGGGIFFLKYLRPYEFSIVLVPIESIKNWGMSKSPWEVVCKSTFIVDNYDYPDPNFRYESKMVVYDANFRPGSLVSDDTVCRKFSEGFVIQAIKEGYRWQQSDGVIWDSPNDYLFIKTIKP
jgi:hypothetical protein